MYSGAYKLIDLQSRHSNRAAQEFAKEGWYDSTPPLFKRERRFHLHIHAKGKTLSRGSEP